MGFFLFQHHFTSMYLKVIVFLFLNFGALALGGIFAGSGAGSDWYNELNKAPWTPPGGFWICLDNNYALLFRIYGISLSEGN